MKATGIVRRIDELGRIVIPKEIRRTMRIRESDPLEIFTDKEGSIILKKYSPVAELGDVAGEFTQSLNSVFGFTAFICDGEHIVSAAGSLKKALNDKVLSRLFQTKMLSKQILDESVEAANKTPITVDHDRVFAQQSAVPIVWNGDVIGAVGMVTDGELEKIGTAQILALKTIAIYLARQIQD